MTAEHSEGRSPVAEEPAESQASEESAADVQSSGTALVIPDVTGLSALDSALAYGAAGIYIVPVHNRTKKPGGLLGNGWQHQSARDAETIRAWFEEWPQTRPLTWNQETQQREPWPTDPGIALHVGRSGMVVFDIDTPEHLHPALVRANGECTPPFQTSRVAQPGKGHALYLVPAGQDLGNSPGRLGGTWGEVRGANGVIIAAPSTHEEDWLDGHYEWRQVGPVPVLPGYVSELLPERLASVANVTNAVVEDFLDDHPLREGDPDGLIAGHIVPFQATTSSAAARHTQMLGHLCGAMREASEGLCDARLAADTLESVFLDAVSRSDLGSGTVRDPAAAADEWAGLLRTAVGAALVAEPGQAAARVEARVTERAAASGLTALPDGDPLLDVPATPAPKGGNFPTTDVRGRLAGTWTPLAPTLLRRDDGLALLYPGRTHSLSGESGSGKSWIAQWAVAQVLGAGGRALYLDYESSIDPIIGRLRALGCTDDQIGAGLDYRRPQGAPQGSDFDELLTEQFDIAIVDGVTESLGLSGLAGDSLTNNNDAITKWHRSLPLRLAESTGAAVVQVDHVTKAKDGRGGYAIGGQAKKATLTGVTYTVETRRSFAPGQSGQIAIRAGKDREGLVMAGLDLDDKNAAGTMAGLVDVDAHPGGELRMALRAVQPLAPEVKAEKEVLAVLTSRQADNAVPWLSTSAIKKVCAGRDSVIAEALARLAERGELDRKEGDRGAIMYRLAVDPEAADDE